MAQSPSPHPATLSGGLLSGRRLSITPPLPQQPLSKRDKKRSQIETKLKEIANDFTNNRDPNLRNQMTALIRDIQYINQADPYQDGPLDDRPDDLSTDISGAAVSGAADGENRMPLGHHAVDFVNEINDAMEERDASLTKTHLHFKKTLEHYRMEYNFALQVAEAEEQALQESARARAINIIQSKKRVIQKEKDLLDTADSNTLLYNSSGFTTTQPGSPGGSHNNRKTRHTRHHRPDPESANEPADSNNKRKRKLPGDFDNESPAPPLRTLGDPPSASAEADSSEPLENYFSAKDLAAHARAASTAVAQVWAERLPHPLPNGDAPNGTGAAHLDAADADSRRGRRRTPDEADAPEPAALLAPAMERSGSYATRSTRNLNPEPVVPVRSALANGGGGGGGGGGGDPRQVFGAAVLDAHAARAKVTSTKDVEAPLSSGLSAVEQAEDMQLLARLMADPAL